MYCIVKDCQAQVPVTSAMVRMPASKFMRVTKWCVDHTWNARRSGKVQWDGKTWCPDHAVDFEDYCDLQE